jgi:uncharacterized pyridoxamine 5'-phosphate oxidase family protein
MDNALQITKETVFSYLREQKLGVIATVLPENKPEAATIDYFIDDNWNIYFLTHEESRKVNNLRKNNTVAMVVGTTLATHTAQIEGTAQIITPTDTEFSDLLIHFAGMKTLYASPLLKIDGINLVIVKVTITWLRWLELNEETKRETFTTIIP